MPDGPPPMLGSNTLRSQAAASGAIWEARQDARQQVTDQFQTIDDPDEVPIRQREGGFGPAPAFLERAQPREAAARFDDQFPRQDLGPSNVREGPEGFVPTEGTRRRSAAREFEADTALDDVDPTSDLQAREGGGFGLAPEPQRELAAADLDPQFPDVAIGADDVTPTGGGEFGLDQHAERRVGAERLEDQTPLTDVAPDDVRRTDAGGFELRDSVIDANRGLFR